MPIALITAELISNALEHGLGRVPPLAKDLDGSFSMRNGNPGVVCQLTL